MKKKFLVLFAVFLVIFTGCTAKINKDVKIKEDNITIRVISSEKENINDDGGYSLVKGEFTKVKLSITNNGDKTYYWTNFTSFKLGDKYSDITVQGDELSNSIEPGTTQTGYVYFKENDSKKLTYYTNISSDNKIKKYYFNIE